MHALAIEPKYWFNVDTLAHNFVASVYELAVVAWYCYVFDILSLYSHSNPNSPAPVPATWPKYDSQNKAYLEFATPIVTDRYGKNDRQYTLWNEVVPKMVDRKCPPMQPGNTM